MSKPQISEQQITDSIVAALQQKINQLPKQPEIPESGIPRLNLRETYKKIIEPEPVLTLPPATSPEDEILPLLPPTAETPTSSLLPLLAVGAILLLN